MNLLDLMKPIINRLPRWDRPIAVEEIIPCNHMSLPDLCINLAGLLPQITKWTKGNGVLHSEDSSLAFGAPRLVGPRELAVLLPGQKPGKPHIAVAGLLSETAAVNDAVAGGHLVLGLLDVENLQRVPVGRFGTTRGSLWSAPLWRHCDADAKLSKWRERLNSPLFLGG